MDESYKWIQSDVKWSDKKAILACNTKQLPKNRTNKTKGRDYLEMRLE